MKRTLLLASVFIGIVMACVLIVYGVQTIVHPTAHADDTLKYRTYTDLSTPEARYKELQKLYYRLGQSKNVTYESDRFEIEQRIQIINILEQRDIFGDK